MDQVQYDDHDAAELELHQELISLSRRGDGWEWTTRMPAIDLEVEYRTSDRGDGLFERSHDGSWLQRLGTMQFALPADEDAAARELINNHFGRAIGLVDRRGA